MTDSTRNLRAMTYNLKHWNASPPNAWADRRPVCKALIEISAPDVIGTQEGFYQQLRDMDDDLPGYAWLGLGREGGSHGEFMAVFYRTDRLDPLEYGHYWLSDTPEVIGSITWDHGNHRMVTWIRFRDLAAPPGAQDEFYFVNTHFDHAVEEARRKAALLVVERLGSLDDDLPIVMTGDFNAYAADSEAYRILVTDGPMRDTWYDGESTPQDLSSFHGYKGPREGGRIDWILTRGDFRGMRSEIITYSEGDQFPSDHFPIVADIAV
jgi:endonuclease/exonuclease/phosphatase family metal-dependent hydrolase